MHAMAVDADRDVRIPFSQALSMNTGFIFTQLVGAQAGVKLPHGSRIGVTVLSAQLWNLLAVNLTFEAGLRTHGFGSIVRGFIASVTALTGETLLGVNVLTELLLGHAQLVGQYGMAIQTRVLGLRSRWPGAQKLQR